MHNEADFRPFEGLAFNIHFQKNLLILIYKDIQDGLQVECIKKKI